MSCRIANSFVCMLLQKLAEALAAVCAIVTHESPDRMDWYTSEPSCTCSYSLLQNRLLAICRLSQRRHTLSACCEALF